MADGDDRHRLPPSATADGAAAPLLGAGDPAPVAAIAAAPAAAPHMACPLVLVGDHAGALIPRSLARLGLGEEDRARHIAIDLGVAALGEALARRTGAAFLAQRYSRLVIDCNRDPAAPDAIPQVSDGTAVPGNAGLGPAARQARIDAVHAPYHAAIAALLDARAAAGARTVFVALHSFTPALTAAPAPRPWTVGVLHARTPGSYASRVLAALHGAPGETIGDNQPYEFCTTDHTVPRHAVPRGLDWVELEIRQDQLLDAAGVDRKADLLARVLAAALSADG